MTMNKNKPCSSPLCCADRLRYIVNNIKNKRVTIVGLGLFGGGEGAARFFCEQGAEVTVADIKSKEELQPAVSKLAGLNLRFSFGPHKLAQLESEDLIVLNTAVPRDSSIVKLAKERNIPLTSPMNIFLSLCRAPVTAVTGSVGKSTTTSMLAHMLGKTGRTVHMGGNIGISMLASLDKITRRDTVVLELSSVQLEDAAALPFSPHVAVVTNILPNHLDRYDSFESYVAAKRNIIDFQTPNDLAVLNREDNILRERWGKIVAGNLLFFDGTGGAKDKTGSTGSEGGFLDGDNVIWLQEGKKEWLFTVRDLPLLGAHNLKNAIAAAVAAKWLGVSSNEIQSALNEFQPLEHRLEKCCRVGGITFYNDSDSTTPDSTIAAINSFSPPITIICGGKDKGVPYDKMADVIVEKVDVLVTIGQCGPLIAQLTREAGLRAGNTPIILEADSLNESVWKAYKTSMPGSTILFSPSCSSFDMFQNFAERGNEFKNIVQNILKQSRPDRASA